MTTSIPTHETALQRERRLFRELFDRLIDTIFNSMFDLRPEKAARRSTYLIAFFLFSGFLISIIYYPLPLWTSRISNLFTVMLSTTSSPEQYNLVFSDFAAFLRAVFTDPRILQYLPVFLASFFIALQSAAIYLADVFELDDVSVARQFINAVALSGSNQTIRIKHGEIADEHLETPAYLIGGPGKVVVELDSVALFERADGTPHIIGPTGNKPGGKESLEGFERFREALDIRDHHVELRDQDEGSKAVESRSRDGIPIKATDVHLMFSIYRGENLEPSAEIPYPFDQEAIKKIVYTATSRVTPHLTNPSTYAFAWIHNMIGIIRGRLSRFMSEHNLSEYLASVGLPELEKAKQREATITQQMQALTRSEYDLSEGREVKHPPVFHARHKIKNLFAQFAEDFSDQTRSSGVQLQWIGVGTWESPVNIVPEKHLAAWMLTQENLKMDSHEAMKRVEMTEVGEKMKELIQKVPINMYMLITDPNKYYKEHAKQFFNSKSNSDYEYYYEEEEEEENIEFKEERKDHDNNMKALLIEYRKQLSETADLIKAKNEEVPHHLQEAIKHISNQIGHWAGQ
ncbi:MAG TPA: hypothetical protein VLA72_05740 [Anaerolineales bacterium]|nr:hypothetical protein [Anaerolineales bacterium]